MNSTVSLLILWHPYGIDPDVYPYILTNKYEIIYTTLITIEKIQYNNISSCTAAMIFGTTDSTHYHYK